ncbi:aldo/keto reductase [Egibacter rhizosphaerae]|uniref:Aldo/keto reductase n=1 Tax=Egibacter rhizosphaerae TaxID=1670831 RepID=A0A411YBV3_9ACTN|nr:aldo/keto reductase [Egibacter rhizosphaerae]QBI18711.1 aldo/keto reductase [Egibacter rhizosphaerae]
MQTMTLGGSGEQVSQVALGCMQMGTRQDEATSFALLDRYTERGGNFLDTANCYMWWHRRGIGGGQSEELLGRWLVRRGRRDDVFLATKGSGMVTDPSAAFTEDEEPDWNAAGRLFEGAGGETLHRAIDGSLQRLGTDYVDLYYVHVDDRTTPLEETLEALDDIVRAGKARFIGWSNVRTWRLERIRQLCDRHGWQSPVAVQQRHTYLRPRIERDQASNVDGEQLDYLAEHDDLTLVAYSPIVQGVYDVADKREGPGLIDLYRGPDTDARLAAVDRVASKVGATGSQVVLAWLLAQRDPRVIPLIGPRTLEQFDELMAALDLRLEGPVLAELDTAGA